MRHRSRATQALLLAPVLLAASLLACSGDSGTDVEPWVVVSISISPSSATLAPGETRQLTASIQQQGGPAGATLWTSSKPGVATVSGSGLVTGVAPGQTVVTAAAGGKSATSTITVEASIPTAPGAVEATPASDTEVDVTWTDLSDDETAFRIERETGAGAQAAGSGPAAAFEQVAEVGPDVTTYHDAGLEPATVYRYRVTACNVAGCSDPAVSPDVATDAELVVQTTTLPDGALGVAYEATLVAAGGAGTRTWTTDSGALPPGLDLDGASGTIQGTPTEAGTFDFTVQVSARGQAATANLSILVEDWPAATLVVFDDQDRSGALDEGEDVLAGVDVSFVDGVGAVAATVESDGSGEVRAILPPGVYGVRASPTDGRIADPAVTPTLEVDLTGGDASLELPMVAGAEAEIGPEGGEVSMAGGPSVSVPAGAFDAVHTVAIVPVDVTLEDGTFTGLEVYPSGLALALPAAVRFPHGAGSDTQVFHLVDGTDVALWQATIVDGETATGYSTHFSTFFLDPSWAGTGTLRGSGPLGWALASLPPSLAGGGTPTQATADVVRGLGRWTSELDALGIQLVRDDGALDPALTVAARDLGSCGGADAAEGRNDRLARLGRDGTIYLNSRCTFATSAVLARGGSTGPSLEGAVVHQLGHLLGLGHLDPATCEPAGGADVASCAGPPTMSVFGSGGLGPLWPEDLALLEEVRNPTGDWTQRGVADLQPTGDWVDGVEVDPGVELAPAPGVVVLDGAGRPVPDVTVLFQQLQGAGTLDDVLAVTGSDGVARLGSWTPGTGSSEEVVGASILYRPDRTSGDAVLERFTVKIIQPPPPPLLEDLLPLQAGAWFHYAFTAVPTGGGDPVTGESEDRVTGTSTSGGTTWYEMTGDGPIGRSCTDIKCEIAILPGEAIRLRVTVPPITAVTNLVRAPVVEGSTWTDQVVTYTVRYSLTSILTNYTVKGVQYARVVKVHGSSPGFLGDVDFYYAEGVGIVKLVAAGQDATTTYELIDSGVD